MKKPSDFHPDLKEEHLIKVAQIITIAYEEAIEHVREDKGDTNWGLGCRRYEWARHALDVMAGTDGYEFLSILENIGNKFTFMVGAIPMRFKRSDAENPDKDIFTQYKNESNQLSLVLFEGTSDPCELSWRMLMDVSYSGEVIRAVFVGATQNADVKCFWEIPRSVLRLAPVAILNTKDEGVELPPTTVTLKGIENKKASKNNDDEIK